MAHIFLGGCERHHQHSDDKQLRAVFAECERMAPIASKWCGYEIPPWLATVTMAEETNFHNRLYERPVKDPYKRSGGFFSIRSGVFCKWAERAEMSYPPQDEYPDLAAWSKAVAYYEVDEPIEQVRVWYVMAAFYLRRYGGRLEPFWSVYRWGVTGETSYPHDCKSITKRYWGVAPPDWRLPKL